MTLNKDEIAFIENAIGYVFKDKTLLSRAFTHSSYSTIPGKNYEDLEFLGDSIVGFVVAEKLYQTYPDKDEGVLTKMRIKLVSEKPLSDAIELVRIAEMMKFGIGETRSKIYTHPSIKCDLFEAIAGAIYLDGGMDEAKKYVLTMLGDRFYGIKMTEDSKSELNEYAFKHDLNVDYVLKSKVGPDHKPVFTWAVFINGVEYGDGVGNTKAQAQQAAARAALDKLLG